MKSKKGGKVNFYTPAQEAELLKFSKLKGKAKSLAISNYASKYGRPAGGVDAKLRSLMRKNFHKSKSPALVGIKNTASFWPTGSATLKFKVTAIRIANGEMEVDYSI